MSTVDAFLTLSANCFGLPLETNREFLERWYHALRAYGTEATDFLEKNSYIETDFTVHGVHSQGIALVAPNFEKRRELMRRQIPYAPLQTSPHTYGTRFTPDSCFLCQNVAQALDSIDFPLGKRNCIHRTATLLVTPNRYPGHPGHSLLLPLEHDDLTKRTLPLPEEKGTFFYPLAPDKTRGHVMTRNELADTIAVARTYNLFANSNHALDDMSVPTHWHFHLYPQELPITSLAEQVMGTPEQGRFPDGIYRAQNTPFDTLLVRESLCEDFIGTVTNIVQKLEHDNQVFTMLYLKGNFFISPRQNVVSHSIRIGSGSPIHWVKPHDSAYIAQLERYIPCKGTFPWERYVFR